MFTHIILYYFIVCFKAILDLSLYSALTNAIANKLFECQQLQYNVYVFDL